MAKCDSCQVVTINGRVCHERGCPGMSEAHVGEVVRRMKEVGVTTSNALTLARGVVSEMQQQTRKA